MWANFQFKTLRIKRFFCLCLLHCPIRSLQFYCFKPLQVWLFFLETQLKRSKSNSCIWYFCLVHNKLVRAVHLFQAQYRYAQAFYELGFVLRAKETNRAARKICSNKDLEIQYERFEKGIHSRKCVWSIYIYCFLISHKFIHPPP